MKSAIVIPFLISFGLLTTVHESDHNNDSGSTDNPSDGQWEPVRYQGGVLTFMRWIRLPDDRLTCERKGEFTVVVSLEDVMGMLTDAGSAAKWMSGIKENVVIDRPGLSEWYTYTLYDIPWPFCDRDMVSHYKISRDLHNGNVYIAVSSCENLVPLKSGISRLTGYHAGWTLTRLDKRNVKVGFCAYSAMPPLFPRSIQDPVIEKIFLNNLVRLKKFISE
jgi:hypothetical protein